MDARNSPVQNDHTLCIKQTAPLMYATEDLLLCQKCVQTRQPWLPLQREIFAIKKRHILLIAPSIFDFSCANCTKLLAIFRPAVNCGECNAARSQDLIIRKKIIHEERTAATTTLSSTPSRQKRNLFRRS